MIPTHLRHLAATIVALVASTVVSAARPLPTDYRAAGISLPEDAGVPPSVTMIDEAGRARALGALIAQPTVLVFADFTCRTLCGPAVAFVAAALEQSGLRPTEQFRLLVVGLDPKDRPADADEMRRSHLGDSPISGATIFLTADQRTIETIASALGYRYRYDAETDQYLHPAAAFVLRADGKVSRVLTAIGLSAEDMRLALVEASEGRAGTLGDQVRLLCSAFDPAHGTYNVVISRVLAGSAIVTIGFLAGGIGWLALATRRGRAGSAIENLPDTAPRQQKS